MQALAQISKYEELRKKPAWTILAADSAPEILGVLQCLLFDQERRLKESVMIEKVTKIFNERQTQTFTREMAVDKLGQWRKAGYLSRNFSENDDEPHYELTPGAFDAISYVSSLTQERVAPTTSRLELLIYAVKKLVDDTDADVAKRLERLNREKQAIDQKIQSVREGNIELPSDLIIRSQIQDILSILEGLDGDFLRVRDRFTKLSNNIQASLLSEEDSVDTVLSEVFKGYDAIQQSEEGKTFESFYRFLVREMSAREMDALLEELETRSFWDALQHKDAEALQTIVKHLNARSRDTLYVMRRLASGLRQLVQNRGYVENRRLKQLLTKARLLSVQAVQEGAVGISDDILIKEGTSVKINSPASRQLYDPSESRTEAEVELSIPVEIDEVSLAAKLMASEIDFGYLKETIAACLKEQSSVTVGQILEKFPAKQGLGTIVGYMRLAYSEADCIENKTEFVQWQDRLGEDRGAEIPLFVFSASQYFSHH